MKPVLTHLALGVRDLEPHRARVDPHPRLVEDLGHESQVALRAGDSEIVVRSAAGLDLEMDETVAIDLGADPASDVRVHHEPDERFNLGIYKTSSEKYLMLQLESLTAKTDAVQGIAWLPRLIPKTKAKLRGELPASLMYCCGGDRAFFKEHDIHPAEFLTLVWRNGDNDTATIDWVLRRRQE